MATWQIVTLILGTGIFSLLFGLWTGYRIGYNDCKIDTISSLADAFIAKHQAEDDTEDETL